MGIRKPPSRVLCGCYAHGEHSVNDARTGVVHTSDCSLHAGYICGADEVQLDDGSSGSSDLLAVKVVVRIKAVLKSCGPKIHLTNKTDEKKVSYKNSHETPLTRKTKLCFIHFDQSFAMKL